MDHGSPTLDLHYELPPELIAQQPAPQRPESQLMVIESGADVITVGQFGPTLLVQLRPDDLVVVNNSRVLHARLRVTRPSGGAGELLLIDPLQHQEHEGTAIWRAMARPAKRLRPEMLLTLSDGSTVTCIERDAEGHWIVQLPVAEQDVPAWLELHGELPLPPYIAPAGQSPERYQTVYARESGSVAAPTAGLHFDEQLWDQVGSVCEVAEVTLHVGAGTFAPVRDGDLDAHPMHSERFVVPADTDRAVRVARAAGRRIVAVGTTSTRVLETVYGAGDEPHHQPLSTGAIHGSTNLLITPGYRFGCVGALVTNFHLPDSTLIALVMAFSGVETTRTAYAEAIARRMRFYSFGDAMFIHGAPLAPHI